MGIRYRRKALKPMKCISEGYALVKERYWLFFGVSLVGMMIAGAVPFNILLGPMMCGIHYCFMRQDRRQRLEFGMLFKGFEQFGPSFVATLLMMIPIMLILVPAYIIFIVATMQNMAAAGPGAPPPPNALQDMLLMMSLFFGLVLVVATVVNALFLFCFPIIADKHVGGVEAVKASIKAAFANLGGIIGLVILQSLLTCLGLLLCYVGAFFVLPITFASTHIAYQQVFGDEPDPEEFDQDRDEGERDYLDE